MEKKVRELIDRHQDDRNLIDEIIEAGWNWFKAPLSRFKLVNKMISTYKNQADFRKANLERAHLEDSFLQYSKFEDARLLRTHLEDANLLGANLKGAVLRAAHLERADLSGTNLTNAKLTHAHLEGATLSGAIIKNTDFTGAHLEGADIQDIEIEKAIGLEFASFNRIDESNKEAARLTYFRLEKYFREHGWPDDQGRVYYRRKVVQRNIWKEDERIYYKIKSKFSLFFDWLCGYGEEPLNVVIWWGIFILLFALIYIIIGGLSGKGGEDIGWDSLYFSGVTFTTLGFGDLYPDPNSIIMKVCAAGEAFIGAFLMPLFVVCLTRKLMR